MSKDTVFVITPEVQAHIDSVVASMPPLTLEQAAIIRKAFYEPASLSDVPDDGDDFEALREVTEDE